MWDSFPHLTRHRWSKRRSGDSTLEPSPRRDLSATFRNSSRSESDFAGPCAPLGGALQPRGDAKWPRSKPAKSRSLPQRRAPAAAAHHRQPDRPRSSSPSPRDRETLGKLLASFGARLIREVSHPTVVATFRLAIAEAVHAPEVARALDSIGRETVRTALRKIMADAAACGLLQGRPIELAEQLGALLWGDLLVSLLLGVAKEPTARESARLARDAVVAFLELHP